MTRTSSLQIYLLFSGVILFWGFNWPMNKIGIAYMPAIWHAAIRLGMGSVCMFLLMMILGKLKIPTRKDLPIVITIGILQIGFFTLLINLGLIYVEAGHSAILVYTIPLWVTPIAVIFFKERITPLKAIGLMFGLAGILILLSPWNMTGDKVVRLYGIGILIGAALCMAISICCVRNMKWFSTPMELLPWQLLVGTIPVMIIALLVSPIPKIEWNTISISAMAYTTIFATVFGNGAITIVSRTLPSITVSVGLLGVPLLGVISAALILDEVVTTNMKIAMLCISCGLICVAFSGRIKVNSPLSEVGMAPDVE